MMRYTGDESTPANPWYMPPMTTFVNVMSQLNACWNHVKKLSIQPPSGILGLRTVSYTHLTLPTKRIV